MSAEPRALSHELLLCTRNRPETVRECLGFVVASTAVPDRIVVVDSSDDEQTARVCQELARDPAYPPIQYQHHEPGLTAQRNAALRLATADLVHFIDDDAMVEPTYFERIVTAFASLGDDVVGVGGALHGALWENSSRLRRFFLLTGDPGTVTRAAVNVPTDMSITTLRPVAWLSGGCMSWRTAVARETLFDESLTGYGLGEDIEFSLRMRHRGQLWVAPYAYIDHREAGDGRPAVRERARAEVLLRNSLVRRHRDLFGWPAFWWSVTGSLLLLPVKAVLTRSTVPLRQFVGVLQGAAVALARAVWPDR